MTALRSQPLVSALLASVALCSLQSAAHPGSAPASRAEREIAIVGAADEPSAVLYGAPDVPLVVIFDGPLKKDGVVEVQGADVRSHAFIPNAVVITPSSPLAAQSSVPVLAPLADGVLALTLAFSRDRRDAIVRIVRRASFLRTELTEGEQRELASLAIETAFELGTCADAQAVAVPRQVIQHQPNGLSAPLVCGGGALTYMRVNVLGDCIAETARLTRGEESTDVLLVQQTTGQCENGTCWLVVARAPPGDGCGFELELLTHVGVPCSRTAVDLKPCSP